MKKVLLASTAVAAFVAFSGAAQAQDPGRADYGATEGGGGAGSAFTVTTKGAVKFYLKYASGDAGLALALAQEAYDKAVEANQEAEDSGLLYTTKEVLAAALAQERLIQARIGGANDGFFALVSGELEINGAATTDSGIDIDTHVDFAFAGSNSDSTETIGGSNNDVAVGRLAIIDELSLKISGGFGAVELGSNDGAEDIFKITGASVAAGTGGIDGDHHQVDSGTGQGVSAGGGGSAGSGDSSDALKATYLTPVLAGFQAGVSLAYSTEGPNDANGGVLGAGVGAKYSGSGSGLDYAVSLVWGDTALAIDGGKPADDGYGGLGIGLSLGGAGASFTTGITIDSLGAKAEDGLTLVPVAWSGGLAYAIGDVANVSLTSNVGFIAASGGGESGIDLTSYNVFVSGDYAVLPGVTLALDLGYGGAGGPGGPGFTGVFRTKAAF